MPRKSRSRKDKASMMPTPAAKEATMLRTVLFIFTSWATSQHNLPALNKRMVDDFCSKYVKSDKRMAFSTVLDLIVTDDQKSDAKNAGVTLITAMQYFEQSRPNLDWLRYHEAHYPHLRKLENVQYVVGLDNMIAAAAARDIRGRLFPQAELYLLRVVPPGVLVVFDTWNAEKYGLPEFHRTLLKDLCKRLNRRLKIYATILDVDLSENQRMDADEAGVILILGRRAEHLDPEEDPVNIRWLSYHQAYYPGLKDLQNIQYLIGYAPMTADAAANIRHTLFPDAKLIQINAVHPLYNCSLITEKQSKLECAMLRIAKEADAVVSIGPSMHDYFENSYRAISDKSFAHVEILPKVAECFMECSVTSQGNIAQHEILSYGVVHCRDDIMNDYSKIAPSIGKVAMTRKKTTRTNLRWTILDIPNENIDTVYTNLGEKLNCDSDIATIRPKGYVSQILTRLQQCHLCVIGSRYADFGFYGLEAIAAGLPTYAYRDSQIGSFIQKYLYDYEEAILVGSEDAWLDKLHAELANLDRAFKRADKIKTAYMESAEVERSYTRVAALLTDGEESSEYLDVAIELNTHQWQKRMEELIAELKIASQQQPVNEHAVAKLKQSIQEVFDILERCQHNFKRKADEVIADDKEKIRSICLEGDCGINQVGNIKNKCLGMSLNFLSIFGLYRFKSSRQTGRFAKLYETWLITDEMREMAAKVNLPLKLEVTYDEKRFEELDVYFSERDGRISEPLKQLHGEISHTFERQTCPSMMVAQPGRPLSQRDNDVEELFPVGDWRVILFKLDQGLWSRQEIIEHLLRIFNIASSAVQQPLSDDVIYISVEITEKIRHILITKPEILYLLGIRAFLVTDMQPDDLNTKALEAHIEIRDTKVSAMTTRHISLLLSHSKDGSYFDLCYLDLEQTGRQRDMQTQVQDLKGQLHNAMSDTFRLEKQHQKILRELYQANKEVKHLEEHLDKEVEDKKKVETKLEKLKQDKKLLQNEFDSKVKVLESQLYDATQEKSIVVERYQGRIKELEIINKIATGKVTEIKSLKEKIQHLETKLLESNDLISKMEEQLLDAQNSASEISTLKDELDRARREKVEIQKELYSAKEQKRVALGKDDDPVVEGEKTEKTDTKMKEGMFSKLGRHITGGKKKSPETKPSDQAPSTTAALSGSTAGSETEMSTSGVEPRPIGGTKYIGRTYRLHDKHESQKWTLQVLGSEESGTEPGQFDYPNGLAWHGDHLVVCDTDNHRIQILNKNKVVIEIIRFDGQFDKEFKPWDVAISPDGHFFITDIGNNQIIICDQNKKIIQIIPQSAENEVRSITVMAAFIFVTDSKDRCLIKYNIKDGKLVARVIGQFNDPHSVIATGNNHLLVSDEGKHVIHVLDADLNFLNSYRNDRLEYPKGLDVDSHGNIYICTGTWPSKGIVKLRSDGQLDSVLFQGERYYPGFIAVNDDITTTIAITESMWSEHQIKVYSVST